MKIDFSGDLAISSELTAILVEEKIHVDSKGNTDRIQAVRVVTKKTGRVIFVGNVHDTDNNFSNLSEMLLASGIIEYNGASHSSKPHTQYLLATYKSRCAMNMYVTLTTYDKRATMINDCLILHYSDSSMLVPKDDGKFNLILNLDEILARGEY